MVKKGGKTIGSGIDFLSYQYQISKTLRLEFTLLCNQNGEYWSRINRTIITF
jgi:hypothetical protein